MPPAGNRYGVRYEEIRKNDLIQASWIVTLKLVAQVTRGSNGITNARVRGKYQSEP